MSDAFEITNPEILNRIESINNGTIKDIVTSGQAHEIEAVVTDTLSGGELANIVSGNYEVPINDGSVNFMHYEGTAFTDAPVTSTTAIAKTTPAGPITEYNSNVTAIQRGRVVQPYNATVTDGKVNLSGAPASGSFGANAAYFLGEVNQAVCAAQVGIMLGKVIDSALYNVNPSYWDSHGMSSLNPETWNNITHGDDSLGASLFNMVFGLNPDTNKGQAYIDQNAFAYMAYYMAQNGFFSSAGYTIQDISMLQLQQQPYPPVNPVIASGTFYISDYPETNPDRQNYYRISSQTDPIYYVSVYTSGIKGILVSKTPFSGAYQSAGTPERARSSSKVKFNKITYYYDSFIIYGNPLYPIVQINMSEAGAYSLEKIAWDIMYIIDNGTESSGSPEGVSNQPDATLPDINAWNDLASVLQSLQNQFPNVWNNAITYNQIQPDGTLKPTTYVPVGWPNTVANPWTDTRPTTDNQPTTQAQPQIDLDTLLDSQTSPLTRTLTQTPTPNPNPDLDVPQNPTDTGDGSSPTPTPPTGSASALWSVYHPTQSQINDFGGWLWGSVFTTDIRKLFEDPIQGVIKLHKVFAPPIDAGSGTIVVGTLDSNVPSATVTQQYVNVDCGYVDCSEVFGNVFDYPPYTEVSIYLPFIGIMPLDVNDVMRSTLHVVYGVDIFTGACLSNIEVTRDGSTVNMYQFAGVCSVEYPLTGVQSSQMLSALLTMGAGLASVAVGGVTVPAAVAAVGGAAATFRRSVSRSGAFSGNSGAMGIKKPYLIIQRPQTKVAQLFPSLSGYPTNVSGKLSEFEGQVVVSDVHVEGMTATDTELSMIEDLLKEGVLL